MTDKEKELVKQYREENKSYKEIADIIGTTKNIVKSHCNNYGLNGFRASSYDFIEQEKKYKDRFEANQPNFKYHSGYTKESKTGEPRFIKCQCRACGHIQERSVCSGNNGRNRELVCDNCAIINRNKMDAEIKSWRDRRDKIRLERRNNKHVTISQAPTRKCKQCGKPFDIVDMKVVYCSKECAKLYKNKANEVRRRHKLRENGKIDWDVTLTKLALRDKGVCHICGEKVDMDADSNSESYGSIDHVKPVSRGGTHTWDNIKLAHRKCNNEKSNKLIYESIGGQLIMIT